MNPARLLAGLGRKYRHSRNLIHQFLQLVNHPHQTYYPDSPRKSKWAIWRDNILWVIKHKELNRYYYIYGLDRKNSDASKHVMPYRRFTRIRDAVNLRPRGMNFNYASLLRDKFVFAQFLSSLQFRTPRSIALLNRTNITWLDNMKSFSLSSLEQEKDKTIDGFCKKLTGIRGEGAFPLRMDAGRLFIGDKQISIGDLTDKITGDYLWQERIVQHPELERLFPHSLNTMRIVTFNNHGRIEVFNAAMRIGTKNKYIDNWGAGGLAVGINLETGRLRKKGFYKPGYGGLVDVHPQSGLVLGDFEVPFFRDCIDAITRAHSYLYGIHSIGWDIAVAADGPVFIEGNEDWDGSFAMCAEEQFKSRFLQMYPANGNGKAKLMTAAM